MRPFRPANLIEQGAGMIADYDRQTVQEIVERVYVLAYETSRNMAAVRNVSWPPSRTCWA